MNFAIFLISTALTLVIALLTTNVKSNLTFVIFVVLTVVGFLAGTLLLVLWYRNNKSIYKLVNTIRKRLPREEIPKMRRRKFGSNVNKKDK